MNAPALPPDVRLMNLSAAFLFSVFALGLAALALAWAVRQPAFAFRGVRVEGDVARNSVSTIRANALPKLAGGFFTMDLAQARRAFEAVPWVRQAVVRREWPARLAVRLEEYRAVALWEGADGSATRLVSSFGEVFDANVGDVEDDGLPTLQGPEGSAPAMLAMKARLEPVLARLDARIAQLGLSDRGSWRAELDSGAAIELGRGSDDEVLARTERFVGTLTQVSSRYGRALEFADLRHRDGYAVRLKGITTTLPAATAAGRTGTR